MFKKSFLLIAIFALILCLGSFSQANQAQETESIVPELSAMHDVIYPIWHTAYPQKDYAALRGYAPEVKNLAEKIFNAKLPGILRDKETHWKEGVGQLKNAVDDYLAAAAGTNDEAMLNAAEALHAKYEMLVRTIRPVLKEIDDFHKVLYVVYHKDLPDKDYAKIKAASEELTAKAEAVSKAAIPERLESKSAQFAKAAAELLEASKELAEIAKADKTDQIEAAVNKVHAKYQNLVKVFD